MKSDGHRGREPIKTDHGCWFAGDTFHLSVVVVNGCLSLLLLLLLSMRKPSVDRTNIHVNRVSETCADGGELSAEERERQDIFWRETERCFTTHTHKWRVNEKKREIRQEYVLIDYSFMFVGFEKTNGVIISIADDQCLITFHRQGTGAFQLLIAAIGNQFMFVMLSRFVTSFYPTRFGIGITTGQPIAVIVEQDSMRYIQLGFDIRMFIPWFLVVDLLDVTHLVENINSPSIRWCVIACYDTLIVCINCNKVWFDFVRLLPTGQIPSPVDIAEIRREDTDTMIPSIAHVDLSR